MAIQENEFDLPIYQDAARYDAEHWWKTDDLAFWKGMAETYGPDVLELASGTGRIALEILKTDATYTGVELSPAFHQQAQEKLSGYGARVSLVAGDIRSRQLGRTFDLILIGFNSFLHLQSDADALAALSCIRGHCHDDTRLVIDLFVPDPLILYRPDGHRIEAMHYQDPETGLAIAVEETNTYDPETERNYIRWYYSSEEKRDFLVYDFTVRMYYPDTMDRLLHDAGFIIEEKWGDYDGAAFGPESNLQIYIARRR